jgi:hypothetical protein
MSTGAVVVVGVGGAQCVWVGVEMEERAAMRVIYPVPL